MTSVRWRRLDGPGHDACRLVPCDAGWQLDGAAVFEQDGLPARLGYEVTCDDAWRTRHGRVDGWIGERSINLDITRTPDGSWTLDGAVVPGLATCVDLDLGTGFILFYPDLWEIERGGSR